MAIGTTAAIIGGAALAGGAALQGYQANKQAKAARSAAGDVREANDQALEEQKRQFDALQKLLKPYIKAGTGAIGAQQDLLGLSGANQQQQAIDALERQPLFQSLMSQGEESILQNASATGGLRGGNTQSALAKFRPQMLSQIIQQQLAGLGGLSTLGQASAAGQGAQGMNFAGNVGNLLASSAEATGNAKLASPSPIVAGAQPIMQGIGTIGGYGIQKGWF